ncbi:MAG: PAS domain-containing sensor histidine kinase [Candidatus Obscuribacterales bacterium]|nr:PAS domain-containing sensor histidine kinase [Candidatus Obscuribacterales bacterium]
MQLSNVFRRFGSSLTNKGLLCLAIPLFIQFAFVCCYGLIVDRSESLIVKEYRNEEVIGHLNWLFTLMATSWDNSLMQLIESESSGLPVRIRSDENNAKTIDQEFNILRSLLRDNKSQIANLNKIDSSWKNLSASLADGKLIEAKQVLASVNSASLQQLRIDMYASRKAILVEELFKNPVTALDLKRGRQLLRSAINAGVLLDVIIAIALFYSFSSGVIKRILVITENSKRLALHKPLEEPLKGSDEIALLDSNFHSMASQLENARSNLEASEKRIRAIISEMPIGLVLIDSLSHIEFANEAAATLFRISPENLAGHLVHELLLKDGELPVADTLTASFSGDTKAQARRYDNSNFHAQIRSKVLDFDGERKVLMSVRDVTAEHELEKAKSEFTAMVCHDLRNPLAGIQLFLQSLNQGFFGELNETGEKLRIKSQNCCEHLMTLTNDILTSEKLTDGKVTLTKSRIDLSSIVEQSIASIYGLSNPKRILILFSQGEGHEVVCDEPKIHRVVTNLLSNACKFSPSGSEIKVEIESLANSVKISVIDNGPGISESQQRVVFEKFRQLNAKDAYMGSGLGLSICKKFVEAHGGEIGVKSKPGEGATFWVSLPISDQIKD